jgi:hypothetical protein
MRKIEDFIKEFITDKNKSYSVEEMLVKNTEWNAEDKGASVRCFNLGDTAILTDAIKKHNRQANIKEIEALEKEQEGIRNEMDKLETFRRQISERNDTRRDALYRIQRETGIYKFITSNGNLSNAKMRKAILKKKVSQAEFQAELSIIVENYNRKVKELQKAEKAEQIDIEKEQEKTSRYNTLVREHNQNAKYLTSLLLGE